MLDPSSFSLSGQRALVTGGATGIGAAIAVAMARCGADVAITVNRSPADDVRAAVEAAGRRYAALPADFGRFDTAAAEDLAGKATAALGGAPTILVNNAGIIRRAPAAEYPQADWDVVIATNLDAVWHLTQAVAQPMLAAGSGRIVTVASLLSFQGGIRVPAYAASKHAVAGLTKALANEWAGRGLTVNAIAPGYIETANTEALRQDADRSRSILDRIPAGRWGQPEDIAGAAVFLASPAATYINGTILTVDGGWMAR
jgi:2-deoxy-D-gluconate 3-dehydrogenase